MNKINALKTEMYQKLQTLLTNLKFFDSIVVAFSGGVDSSVLARAAIEARGDKALALCAVSPSMPEREPERIANLACEIGIKLLFIHTDELTIPDYRKNPENRCFFAKNIFYSVFSTSQRKKTMQFWLKEATQTTLLTSVLERKRCMN